MKLQIKSTCVVNYILKWTLKQQLIRISNFNWTRESKKKSLYLKWTFKLKWMFKTGPHWDWTTLRLDHTETGQHWDWTTLRLDHSESGPHWEWATLRVDHPEIGPYWEWTTLRLDHTDTAAKLYTLLNWTHEFRTAWSLKSELKFSSDQCYPLPPRCLGTVVTWEGNWPGLQEAAYFFPSRPTGSEKKTR